MIKAVVFDLDGVVFLEEELFSEKLNREYDIDLDDILEFFEHDFEDCLRGQADLKRILEDKYLRKWGWNEGIESFLKLWFDNGKINQQIIDFIKDLQKKGIICILCTNNERYRLEHLSKKFSFENLFDKIIASHEIGSKKPEKKVFEKILEVTRLKPTQILFCDDDKGHINAALSGGFNALHFKTMDDLRNEFRNLTEEDYSRY